MIDVLKKIELLKSNSRWEAEFVEYMDDETTNLSPSISKLFSGLIESAVQSAKQQNFAIKELEKVIVEPRIVKYIDSIVNDQIEIIKLFESISKLDVFNIQSMVNLIFDSYVIRRDTAVHDHFELYKFKNPDEFSKILNRFKQMTDYCIVLRLTYSSIKAFFHKETNLDENTCGLIADRIEKSFNELKLNYIIESIGMK